MTTIGRLREQVRRRSGRRSDALTARLDAWSPWSTSARARGRLERKAAKAWRLPLGGAGRRGRGAGHLDQWKATGDRVPHAAGRVEGGPRDRPRPEQQLWKRFSAARTAFDRASACALRLAGRAAQEARRRPRRSWSPRPSRCPARTDWGATAAGYRDLMTEWKAAGRAQRGDDDALWNRFSGAQDVFFAARNSDFAERDAEQTENLELKEELADGGREARPGAGPEGGRASLRYINARWEAIGHVPRDARPKVEATAQAGSRTRSARPRRTSGAGPTPQRGSCPGTVDALETAMASSSSSRRAQGQPPRRRPRRPRRRSRRGGVAGARPKQALEGVQPVTRYTSKTPSTPRTALST